MTRAGRTLFGAKPNSRVPRKTLHLLGRGEKKKSTREKSFGADDVQAASEPPLRGVRSARGVMGRYECPRTNNNCDRINIAVPVSSQELWQDLQRHFLHSRKLVACVHQFVGIVRPSSAKHLPRFGIGPEKHRGVASFEVRYPIDPFKLPGELPQRAHLPRVPKRRVVVAPRALKLAVAHDHRDVLEAKEKGQSLPS